MNNAYLKELVIVSFDGLIKGRDWYNYVGPNCSECGRSFVKLWLREKARKRRETIFPSRRITSMVVTLLCHITKTTGLSN
jgi:hypothetical protein